TPTPKPISTAPTCSNTQAPVAHNDKQTATVNQTTKETEIAIIDVQHNDVSAMSLLKESTRLIDASGDEVTTLDVEDKGTWDVDIDTGKVSFTPEDDFNGTVSTLYTVKDNCDRTSNKATISVSYTATCTDISDNGNTLGTLSMLLLMILTGSIGLYYIRREVFENKKD
ncbi:MAG: hypothetical protein DSZ12_05880, partial [Sulfurovum sp.]